MDKEIDEYNYWFFVKEVKLDARRRISLKGAGLDKHTRYRMTERADGSILLEPMVSVMAKDLK